jgi:hypothetical protein
VLTAAVTATGAYLAHSTATHPAATPATPPNSPAATAPTRQGGTTASQPVVLADGRHPVYLTTVTPPRPTITVDLVHWYVGDDATRAAAKDHQESPPPNDSYLRNSNPDYAPCPCAPTPPSPSTS